MKKILTFLLIVSSIASCANRNNKEVLIAIDSDPTGAKIYIDDKYYGQTVRQVSLVPNKNYHLRLVKDGYKTVDTFMETEFSMRKRRAADYRRCKGNLTFSFLLFPLIALNKAYCRDFTKSIYYFDLEKDFAPAVYNYGASYVPPEYVPPQSAAAAQNIYNNRVVQLPPTVTQPVLMQQVPVQQMEQPMSGSYSNPYQNYQQVPQGQAMQAPTDFDSAYKAPYYYNQSQPYTVARGGWVDGSTGQNFNQEQPAANYYYDDGSN